MNNDFQRFGNGLTAYVKKNNFSFSTMIFKKRTKKKRGEIEIKLSKWFEPRSISSSCSVIVRVSVVLKRTVGDSD